MTLSPFKKYMSVMVIILVLASGFDLRTPRQHYYMQNAEAYLVSTLAGSKGTREPKDGNRSEASFTSDLSSLAVDASGNVYVNDAQSLRKISPNGTVATLFGQNIYDASGKKKPVERGLNALDDGGIAEITSLAVHTPTGKLYMSALERVIYTLAGTQVPVPLTGRFPEANFNEHPNGDGDLKTAIFRSPQDMCVDEAGNIYLVDKYRMVRKISVDGKVTTLAGKVQDTRGQQAEEPVYRSGPVATATLANIGGIAVDSKGNLFISQQDIHCIVKITPTGVVSTFAGDPASTEGQTLDGIGTRARFFSPGALTIDSSDNLFVADKRKVRKISPQGNVTTIAGGAVADDEWQALYKDGDGSTALFTSLKGIGCDRTGIIYVVDEGRVRKITRN